MNNPTKDQRIVGAKVILSIFDEATEQTSETVVLDEKIVKDKDTLSLTQSTPPVKNEEGKYVPGNTRVFNLRLEKSR